MGPGPGDQPLQVPGEPLAELLVISPDGPWHPPALGLRPEGQEWTAPEGRCCCSRKDPWSPQSPPGRGSTPAPATRVRRRAGSRGLPHTWVVARGPTHPRLESQPGLTLGPWLPRATQGLDSAEGRLGGRLGPCHHSSSLSIRVPGLPVRLRSRVVTFTSARHARAPLCTAGSPGKPCPYPAERPPLRQCHRSRARGGH